MSSAHLSIPLNDGTSAPWVAFGTGTALYGRDASRLVELAIQNGITHLDGAQAYNNEESLGEGVKASGKPRSELYIVTKLNKVLHGMNVKESLQGSLKKLGVDYVDLFLIHNPLDHDFKQVWKEMEGVQKDGLTKSIGVSNFNATRLESLLEDATVVPAVNQIEYHPYVFAAADPIIKLHQKLGIVTASYGGLTPIVRVQDGPLDPVLESISQRLGTETGAAVSSGQILTKLLQQKGVIVVTTSSKESRIKEYLEAGMLPDLTAEELQAIEAAGSKLHKRVFMRGCFDE